MVKSATRTLEILEVVADAPDGLTHTDIAKALRIPKSSLTNLLRSLAIRRYLLLDPISGLFTIGPAVLPLSRAFLGRLDLVKTIAPIAAGLRDAVAEATILATLDGNEIVVIHQEQARHPLSAIMRVGDRAPALLTAAGKALVASLPEEEIEALLRALPEQSPAPIRLSADMLCQQLDEIRHGALAISREEYVHGIIAVGLPVFGAEESRPAAAITVNLPTARFNDRKLRQIEGALRQAAEEASLRLGGTPPQGTSSAASQLDEVG